MGGGEVSCGGFLRVILRMGPRMHLWCVRGVYRRSLPTLFGWAIRHFVNYSAVCLRTRPAPFRANGAGGVIAYQKPLYDSGTRRSLSGEPGPAPDTFPLAAPAISALATWAGPAFGWPAR